MSLVALLTAAFLIGAFVLAARRLPWLHPLVLWTASWAIVGTLFSLDLLPYRDLSVPTALIICTGTGAFALGTLGGERAFGRLLDGVGGWIPSLPGGPGPDASKLIERAALTALALAALGLAAFVVQTSRAFGLDETLLVRAEVRIGLGEGASSATIKYLYASVAAAALCGIAAAMQPDPARTRTWLLLTAFAVASTYFATGRSTIVIAAAVATLAFWLGRDDLPSGRRVFAGAGALAVLAISAMLAIGELQGKTFENNDIGRVQSAFSDSPVLRPFGLPYEYGSASFAALDKQVAETSAFGVSDGCATASGVCSVLASANLGPEAVPFIRPFTAPPLRWNLYTALDLPLLDGGFALVLPIVVLVGAGFGAVWAAAARRLIPGVVAYAIAGPTLLLSGNQFGFLTPHVVGGALLGLALLAAWWALDKLVAQSPASTPS